MCTELDIDKIRLTCVPVLTRVSDNSPWYWLSGGCSTPGVKVADKLQLIVLAQS